MRARSPEALPGPSTAPVIGIAAKSLSSMVSSGDAANARDENATVNSARIARTRIPSVASFYITTKFSSALVCRYGDGALDILIAGQEGRNVVWHENRIRKVVTPGRR